jgi:riboflavin biosynthesis pyrimidine reductase
MKPYVTMLMMGSLDGGLHPSRFTSSRNGTRRDWSAEYEKVHAALQADAWLVGRVTMAEMSKAQAHVPPPPWRVDRPSHVATQTAKSFAVALDPGGKVHFKGGEVAGDHAIALLGAQVSDGHLAELASDGVSYLISPDSALDTAALFTLLGSTFGIRHLVLEGGARTNGALLAAGLVDELQVLVAPALDAGDRAERIVSYAAGLAGAVALEFASVRTLDHGVVLLCYKVGAPA